MTPSQGDVVLVPVPFTDLKASRKRPVIVLSRDAYQNSTVDLVAIAMTTNLAIEPHSFVITSSDLVAGVLAQPSRVRADKIMTLAQSIIIKKFGRVSPAVLDRIRKEIAILTS
jgi:mRNA interferase MazF